MVILAGKYNVHTYFQGSGGMSTFVSCSLQVTKAKLDEKAEEWSSRAHDWDRLSQEWREEVRSLRDENQEFRFQV